jgi:hypothetical protein
MWLTAAAVSSPFDLSRRGPTAVEALPAALENRREGWLDDDEIVRVVEAARR